MVDKSYINKLNSSLKDAQALELRKAGASFDQIAQHLGYAQRSGAHHAVQRALRESLEKRNQDADEVRELELSRLDDMFLGLWKDAKAGKWLAVDRALRIMERRAAYLGLDAPKKQEISGSEGGPIQIEQTVDVNVSLEERRTRVLELIREHAKDSASGTLALGKPDLDSSEGSPGERLADAG